MLGRRETGVQGVILPWSVKSPRGVLVTIAGSRSGCLGTADGCGRSRTKEEMIAGGCHSAEATGLVPWGSLPHHPAEHSGGPLIGPHSVLSGVTA